MWGRNVDHPCRQRDLHPPRFPFLPNSTMLSQVTREVADPHSCNSFHHDTNITLFGICQFVNSTPSCRPDDGFIDYLNFIYCTFAGCDGLAACGVFVNAHAHTHTLTHVDAHTRREKDANSHTHTPTHTHIHTVLVP